MANSTFGECPLVPPDITRKIIRGQDVLLPLDGGEDDLLLPGHDGGAAAGGEGGGEGGEGEEEEQVAPPGHQSTWGGGAAGGRVQWKVVRPGVPKYPASPSRLPANRVPASW